MFPTCCRVERWACPPRRSTSGTTAHRHPVRFAAASSTPRCALRSRTGRQPGYLRVAQGVGGPRRGGLAGVEEDGGGVNGPSGSGGPVSETQTAVLDLPGQAVASIPDLVRATSCGDQPEAGVGTSPRSHASRASSTWRPWRTSRRCAAGFALGEHHYVSLAKKAALCMAAAVRGGDVAGVIFHSDKGGQYTGDLFANVCNAADHPVDGTSRLLLDNAAGRELQLDSRARAVVPPPLRHQRTGAPRGRRVHRPLQPPSPSQHLRDEATRRVPAIIPR